MRRAPRIAACVLATALTSAGAEVTPPGGAAAVPESARPAASRPSISLERLATIDIPGPSAEILAWVPSQRLLCAVNPVWSTLDLFRVERFEPPVLTPLPDFEPDKPGIRGLPLGGSPTSVAAHPTEPLVLMTVLGDGPSARGRLLGFDLREAGPGQRVVDQLVGYHPDSLAISRDGRWAIVANEGEGSSETPGTVTLIDLRGLTAARRAEAGPLPSQEIGGLGGFLGIGDGEVEPEYVAIDPQSRFAAVSCQENDAVLLIDLTSEPAKVAGVLRLPEGAEPDGVSVVDGVPGPDGRLGCLLAVGEEGRMHPPHRARLGNSVSFWWIDPKDLSTGLLRSRVDVRPLVDPHKPEARRDPEGVLLLRLGEGSAERLLCLVVIERGDRVLCLDVTDATAPVLASRGPTGSRPEGIITVPVDSSTAYVLTGDEGTDGPGEITVLRLRVGEGQEREAPTRP